MKIVSQLLYVHVLNFSLKILFIRFIYVVGIIPINFFTYA